MRQDLEPRLQASGGLRLFERRDEVGQGAVVDASSTLRGRDRQTDGQVRLANARRLEQDDILSALHEAELVQTFDLLTAERRLEREIEIAELFDHG